MKMHALVRLSKSSLLAIFVVAFGGQSLVYANIFESNQCAKLFEVQKHAPSFKEFMKQKIRAVQEAQNKSSAEQTAEGEKQKEEEERQKREAMDHKNLGFKIQFLKIPPRKFVMGEGKAAKKVEIKKPYEIMDKKMTQLMYARLMILMGYKKLSMVFPSYFTDGINSVKYDFYGIKVPMRPDDPVTNVSWDDIYMRFIPELNNLSKLEIPEIQYALLELIPDHQIGDVYDFVTDAQMENVMRLAKTIDGDTIDSMIARDDHEKLEKYVVYDQNSNSSIGTHPEASLLPLFIDGKPIYLHGNAWEWMKGHVDWNNKLITDKDFRVAQGPFRSVRGGSWLSLSVLIRSRRFGRDTPETRNKDLGFRLARVSRGGIHNNLGGTP